MSRGIGVEDLDEAHHERVGAPAGVAGDEAVGGADEEADERAAMPTSSEMRAPSSTRERTSRPLRSVPKGCAQRRAGELVALERRRAVGRKRSGPKIATKTTNARTTRSDGDGIAQPRPGAGRRRSGVHSFEPDAAVEPRVGDVHDEVQDDEQRAIDDDHASEQEDVAVEDRVDEESARAGDVEDRFDDERAGEQIRGERAEKARPRAGWRPSARA